MAGLGKGQDMEQRAGKSSREGSRERALGSTEEDEVGEAAQGVWESPDAVRMKGEMSSARDVTKDQHRREVRTDCYRTKSRLGSPRDSSDRQSEDAHGWNFSP
eukprot:752393-Hanusia_phi.AAC.7